MTLLVAGSSVDGLIVNDTAMAHDGSIIVVGATGSRVLASARSWAVVCIAADGAERWSRQLFGDDVYPNSANGVAIDAQGRILVTGRRYDGQETTFRTIRLLADSGQFDSSFGDGGIVDTTIDGRRTTFGASSVAVQSSGRIVVAGSLSAQGPGGGGTIVLGYDFDGSRDATFGTTGPGYTVTEPSGLVSGDGGTIIYPTEGAIAIDGEDRIVLGGNTGGFHSGWVILRYDAGGALDSSFGGDGAIESGGSGDRLYDVALQPDGRIVAAGEVLVRRVDGSIDPDRFHDLAVTRHDADGSPDSSFAESGVFLSGFSASQDGFWDGLDGGRAVAIDDGHIIVAGYFYTATDNMLFALRLDLDGEPDAEFGPHGNGRSEDAAIGWDTAGLGVHVDADGVYSLPFSVAQDDTYTTHDYGRARVSGR